VCLLGLSSNCSFANALCLNGIVSATEGMPPLVAGCFYNRHARHPGYKKGELEGKNISVLMPPPYSTRHNGYLKAYQATGAREWGPAHNRSSCCGWMVSLVKTVVHDHRNLAQTPSSGNPHILDAMVEVVAVHKDRHILPVTLGVCKASGSGADAVFMSVVKVGGARQWASQSLGAVSIVLT
jgi:hypothetical protein